MEKFKPKKTTDDCYTPPEIYEVIKDWACAEKRGTTVEEERDKIFRCYANSAKHAKRLAKMQAGKSTA